MNRTLLLLVALTPSVGFAADCPTAYSANQITASMQDAMLSFATMDEEEFYNASGKAIMRLPCVDSVFESPRAAAYHRLMGMSGFMQGDRESAGIAFQSALRVEPDFELSGKIAPEGGRLWRVWDEARQAAAPEMTGIDVPPGHTVYVDGVKAKKRPVGVPHIVQFMDSSGDMVWSGWVGANGDLPQIAAAAVAEVEPVDEWNSGSTDDEWGSAGSDDEWGDMGSKPDPKPEPKPDPRPEVDWNDAGDDDGWGDTEADDGWGDTTEDDTWAKPPEDLDKPDPLPMKPVKTPREKSSGGGVSPLLLAGVGAGVAAGGLLGGSVYFRGQFDQNQTAAGFHLTNGTHYASIGTGTIAAALVIAGISTGGK